MSGHETDNAQYESLAGKEPAVVDATPEDMTDRIIRVIESLGRGLEQSKPDLTGEPIKQLTLLAKRMHQLSVLDEAIKVVTKALNTEYDIIKLKSLPDLMLELDMRTFTVEGAGRVQLGGDVYASIPADKREEAFKWLRENKYESLIQETVNSSTFKAWCKEGEAAGREIPKDLFKVTPYNRVSLVKVKAKKKG